MTPPRTEIRFISFSLIILGIILVPLSLMFARAFGDIAWSLPRVLGAGSGVFLIVTGFVMLRFPLVLVWFVQRKRLVSVVLQLLLFIWTIICASLLLEIGTRIFLVVNRDISIKTSAHLMASRPLPYQDADYFSSQFLDESFLGSRSYTPLGTRMIIPLDRVGQYINVSNGRRHTKFQPELYQSTVYLIGGSTILCAEVSDQYTVASYLQKLFRESFDDRYRVENLGAAGVVVSQQLERLQTIKLAPDDIVIFYDGANDIIFPLYYGGLDGFIVGDNAAQNFGLKTSPLQMLKLNFYTQFGGRSEFVNIFLYPYDPFPYPVHLLDTVERSIRLNKIEKRYESNLREAQSYSVGSGAKFFHFFQPSLFTLSHLTSYEKKYIFDNKYIVFAGLDDAFRLESPALQKITNSLLSEGSNSFDISNILNERNNGEEFYLDFIHVNHHANERIAKTIFEKILIKIKQ